MVAEPKFTLPLMTHLINNLNLGNHRFIIIPSSNVKVNLSGDNIIELKSPLSKHIFSNLYKVIKEIFFADKIISHGAQFPFFYFLVPHKIKRVLWVIYGGYDIPVFPRDKKLSKLLDIFFKKLIKTHVSHIEEDSDLINKTLKKYAKFIYSPGYLSNIVSVTKPQEDFIYIKGLRNQNILVGNSTDPSNNHIEAYKQILNNELDPNSVSSVLSYGNYPEYMNEVVDFGTKSFGEKFKPITHYMNYSEYLSFLESIDFVIFNHSRQEAMGVTIQLLSLGKPIFFNPNSPAYKSFVRRGYRVFNLNEIDLVARMKVLDLTINRELLQKHYSLETLNSCYKTL
jgi:dTDP-N-acetylfucosamine:lipid II N-acetylfucosaminyltransferase